MRCRGFFLVLCLAFGIHHRQKTKAKSQSQTQKRHNNTRRRGILIKIRLLSNRYSRYSRYPDIHQIQSTLHGCTRVARSLWQSICEIAKRDIRQINVRYVKQSLSLLFGFVLGARSVLSAFRCVFAWKCGLKSHKHPKNIAKKKTRKLETIITKEFFIIK